MDHLPFKPDKAGAADMPANTRKGAAYTKEPLRNLSESPQTNRQSPSSKNASKTNETGRKTAPGKTNTKGVSSKTAGITRSSVTVPSRTDAGDRKSTAKRNYSAGKSTSKTYPEVSDSGTKIKKEQNTAGAQPSKRPDRARPQKAETVIYKAEKPAVDKKPQMSEIKSMPSNHKDADEKPLDNQAAQDETVKSRKSTVSSFDPEKLRAELAQQSEARRRGQTDVIDTVSVKTQTDTSADVAIHSQNPEYTAAGNDGGINQGNSSKSFFQIVGLSAVAAFFGNAFYSLGFFADCRVRRVLRVLRDFALLVFQMLAWLFGGVGKWLKQSLKNLVYSILAPLRRIKRGFANIKQVVQDERESGSGEAMRKALGYFGIGVLNHGHLIENLVGVVLTVGAILIFAFTINSLLDINYALAVMQDGKVIGYVEDQGVVEDAKKILRGRLKLGTEQNYSDWQFNPELSIGRAKEINSKQQLVNTILKDAEFDIVQATGLYVNNDLFAVTTNGEELANYLESIKTNYIREHADQQDAEIQFVQNIECEPNTDDVFLKSSVLEYDDLMEKLSQNLQDAKYYSSESDQTLSEVAFKNDIQLRTLKQLNPQYSDADNQEIVPAGTKLLVQKEKPLLQIQSTKKVQKEQPISFKKVIYETEDKAEGWKKVTTPGQDGVQEIWENHVYVDGELVKVERIDELTKIIVPPVDEVTTVGTYSASNITGDFNKVYINPVPDSVRSSRGMSAGHRGRDINAPTGTPMYAANAGEVIVAGYHYSYGNYIMIKHPDGLVTLYAHCNELYVEAGTPVKQNQKIASVGSTGNSSGPHLHIEFQTSGGALLNPDDYITGSWSR